MFNKKTNLSSLYTSTSQVRFSDTLATTSFFAGIPLAFRVNRDGASAKARNTSSVSLGQPLISSLSSFTQFLACVRVSV